MAIKTISYENFRGQTRKFDVGAVNIISGKNGSGKSTIKEAIVFAFCGCDSLGSRKPTHLISKDKDSMRVVIITDKSTISRTLTRSGSSTIRVDKGGMSSTFSQSEMETIVGKPDTFMSALIPGYFFTLEQKLKQSVLEDILPKVDKVQIIEDVAGITLTSEEKLKYGFNRRADLIASSVAQDRRTLEASVNQKLGRIAQLSELSGIEEPKIKDKSKELEAAGLNQELWSAYNRDIKFVTDRNTSVDRALAENAYTEKRRSEIEQILSTLTKAPKPELVENNLNDLHALIKPNPSKPVVLAEIDSDHCNACGQAVSPKYRQQMKERNAKLMNDWRAECIVVEEANAKIRADIQRRHQENEESKKAYLRAIEDNRKIEAQKMALERELYSLTLATVPEKLPLPQFPEVAYDRLAHTDLIKHQEEYKNAWAVYEFKKKEFQTAKEQIDSINSEITVLDESVERLKKLEDALKELPALETKKQIGVFNTEKLVFDGSSIVFDGTPLRMLSTGERAKVELFFSRKIMSLMATPHNIIFIDDADIIDSHEVIESAPSANEQVFKAYVKDKDISVDIA